MDSWLVIFTVLFGLLVVTPAVLFRPLVIALADRISGKKAGNSDIKELRDRVKRLEGELMEMRCTVIAIESSQEFHLKLTDEKEKPRIAGSRKD